MSDCGCSEPRVVAPAGFRGRRGGLHRENRRSLVGPKHFMVRRSTLGPRSHQMIDCRERLRRRDFRPPPLQLQVIGPRPFLEAPMHSSSSAGIIGTRSRGVSCGTGSAALGFSTYSAHVNMSRQYGMKWTVSPATAIGGIYAHVLTTLNDLKGFIWNETGTTLIQSAVRDHSADPMVSGNFELITFPDCAEMNTSDTYRITAMRDTSNVSVVRGVYTDASGGLFPLPGLIEVRATSCCDAETYPATSSAVGYRWGIMPAY